MSFCVLRCDNGVLLAETRFVNHDFSSYKIETKLADKSFIHDAKEVKVLVVSNNFENCEKFITSYVGKNRECKLNENMLGELGLIRMIDSTEDDLATKVGRLEIDYTRLKQDNLTVKQDLITLKKDFRSLNARLNKIEETNHCAQIKLDVRSIDTDFVIKVPPMDKEDTEFEFKINKDLIQETVRKCNLNITFREVCRLAYTHDELIAHAPKDKRLAEIELHKLEFIKLFAIQSHNTSLKKNSQSGIYDSRMVKQTDVDNQLRALTTVWHSMRSEERTGKGKKRKITELVAPIVPADSNSESDNGGFLSDG